MRRWPRTSHTSSLIGAALRLLTDNAENQATLKTALGTLTRVLDAVDWPKISKGNPETWLYFYEDFLEVYDNKLRKQTGSYYTPPEVVGAMVGLVDEVLSPRASGSTCRAGLATVTVADPATGTGTFVLGVLRRIAETVQADEGEGAVKGAINAAVKRLIALRCNWGRSPSRSCASSRKSWTSPVPRPRRPRGCSSRTRWAIPRMTRDGFPAFSRRSPSPGRMRTRSSARSRSPS